ncbi:MAG: NUDIX hydrolase [Candidatus Pacebacteria bacterium]|nr:NUDIX hydrolase [Candidatus Paceibacterota bacterium]
MENHSDKFPDCFYRVTIKGLCVKDSKILLVREAKAISGNWELPGGGLDFGENIRTGLKREIEEEMGLKVRQISNAPVYVWTHRYPSNSRNIGWYYSCVIAYRIELESLNFTPSDECEAIDFFSKEELKTINLNGQTTELADIFNPEDFKDSF